jgi:hypothetical protein
MGAHGRDISIIYLLLVSYSIIYFFYACRNIFFQKCLLPTTNYFKSSPVKVLICSRLFSEPTTKLLQIEGSKLDKLHLIDYISDIYTHCSV